MRSRRTATKAASYHMWILVPLRSTETNIIARLLERIVHRLWTLHQFLINTCTAISSNRLETPPVFDFPCVMMWDLRDDIQWSFSNWKLEINRLPRKHEGLGVKRNNGLLPPIASVHHAKDVKVLRKASVTGSSSMRSTTRTRHINLLASYEY